MDSVDFVNLNSDSNEVIGSIGVKLFINWTLYSVIHGSLCNRLWELEYGHWNGKKGGGGNSCAF